MIPKKLQPSFETISTKTSNDNYYINGDLSCCDSHNFEIFIVGTVKHSIFSRMYIESENEILILEGHCKKCGKNIPVFNNQTDGYFQHAPKKHIYIKKKTYQMQKMFV